MIKAQEIGLYLWLQKGSKLNMKILFVASVYRHLVSFHIPYIQYFQEQGYSVYAVGNGDEDKFILSELGITCIDIPFSRNPFSTDNYQAYKQLYDLFKGDKFQLVHVNTPVAAFLTRLAYRNLKSGPIVYTAHGFHFFEGSPLLNWAIYYPLEKIAAHWTDHLITMNQEDFRIGQRFLSKEKLSIVHGVGVEFTNESVNLDQLKQSLNLRDDVVVISCVGEMNKNKNQQYLLKNWATIKEQCPKVVLLLAGTGELEQQLKDYVNQHQLKDVHFLGYRNDVGQLLEVSHISTLLSYREGLPKSTIEAMYKGLPCIVTDTRGLRDLIRDGENGYVIPLDYDEKLVETFVKLIQSQSLREKFRRNSIQLVEPFLLENVLPEYKAIYQKLMDRW